MRWPLLLLVCSILIPQCVHAQLQHYSELPRYELGVQANIHYLDGVGEWGGGIGGRFHYNFDRHFALDSELTYRQHDLMVVTGTSVASRVVGQTSACLASAPGSAMETTGSSRKLAQASCISARTMA